MESRETTRDNLTYTGKMISEEGTLYKSVLGILGKPDIMESNLRKRKQGRDVHKQDDHLISDKGSLYKSTVFCLGYPDIMESNLRKYMCMVGCCSVVMRYVCLFSTIEYTGNAQKIFS